MLNLKTLVFCKRIRQTPTTTGAPRYYSVFDVDNFLLAPTPNAVYTAELHYFYRPVSLTSAEEGGTTWLSENAELTLLYGALVEAYLFMKGEPDMMQYYDKAFSREHDGTENVG